MHDFFVCEAGPMGGIHIIFVANDTRDVKRFLESDNAKNRNVVLYTRVDPPYDF